MISLETGRNMGLTKGETEMEAVLWVKKHRLGVIDLYFPQINRPTSPRYPTGSFIPLLPAQWWNPRPIPSWTLILGDRIIKATVIWLDHRMITPLVGFRFSLKWLAMQIYITFQYLYSISLDCTLSKLETDGRRINIGIGFVGALQPRGSIQGAHQPHW